MVVNMNKQQTTNNITVPNKDLEILKKHFSHCFNKNKDFDIEKFKKELSKNEIDFSKESYGMDWLGKSYTRILASDEATTLLKEDVDFNKNNENKKSQNLLIKGDNLEVLKHLSNAYREKIKMIYIDPPYNTGSDGFVYQDDRKFTVEELSKLAGIDEEKAKRILEFTQSKSNSHSAWLTFMYPRLYIAKQLLKEDGVIFISIDDNEVAQLRLLMDEIFGEDNSDTVIWKKIDPKYDKNTNAKIVRRTKRIHEYLLVAYKNKESTLFGKIKKLPQWKNKYNNIDNDPRGNYKQGIISFEEGHKKEDKKSENYYTITLPSGRNMTRHFFVLKEEFEELRKDNRIYFPKNGDGVPAVKIFENEKKDFFFETILEGVGSMNSAKKEISEEFNVDEKSVPFDTPKPTLLLLEIIRAVSKKTDLILDFFAGSGTTGDAVMQLNAEDGGNRKYILVQIPESIDEKKNKTAFDFVKDELKVEEPTIFEICKERLIRAGGKIKKDNKDKDLSNVDFGFKIFETTPIWEDYNFDAEEFDPQTKLFDENQLSDNDLKILLTTWKTYDGISLTQDLKEIDLDDYKGYYFDTKLYLMTKGFKTKNLKKLLEEIDENKNFNPATIIAFGYNFESKVLREIAENVKNYANKKHIDIDFITRY
jgi:adenine-specific DNA-methyltransferase